LDRERLQAIVAERNRRQRAGGAGEHRARLGRRGAVQRVAQSIGVSRPMVWRWQHRFAEAAVEGLLRDKTRKPGKPPIAGR
jgi:hypothetical protein